MYKLLLTSILLSVAFPSAAEWVQVRGTDASRMYIDLNDIRADGNVRRIWLLIDSRAGGQPTSRLSARALNEIDCVKKQRREMLWDFFEGQMGTGARLRDERIGEWFAIMPDSIGEDMFRLGCAR